jgi:hypothetical protein
MPMNQVDVKSKQAFDQLASQGALDEDGVVVALIQPSLIDKSGTE